MRSLPVLTIIFVGCLVSLPLIACGVSVMSADGATQALWCSSFSDQLWSGELYPRWLASMNDGLGSPTFFYYPPVPFFLTAVLKPLFQNDLTGAYQVGVSAAAAICASGVCAWLWLRDVSDRTSATTASMLYMITPYHLLVDLYLRSALAELWAFVWMPLVLFFTHRVAQGRILAAAGLAISYALLIGTHLPSTLMFSLVPLGYAVIVAESGKRIPRGCFVAGSMLVGIALSAIFLYPAMTTQSSVFLDRMNEGYFYYQNWFLFTNFAKWPDDKMRMLLLVADLAIAAGSAYVVILQADPDRSLRRQASFWVAVASVAILMMTSVTDPIWSIVTPLQKLQFPWRFNVVLALAVALLSALAIMAARRSGDAVSSAMLIGLFSVVVWIPVAAWGVSSYFMPPDDVGDVLFRNKEVNERRDVPEYRPRASQTMEALDWKLSAQGEWGAVLENEFDSLRDRVGPEKVRIVDGAGREEIESWEPRRVIIHTISDAALMLQVRRFYYPGMDAKLIGATEPLHVEISSDGLPNISVPPGDHQIALELPPTSAEKIGGRISLVALIGIMFYVAALWVRARFA